MNSLVINLHLLALALLLHLTPTLTLNPDGVLLLSFRYSILGDPLSVLQDWNYDDATPCSWNGVTCSEMGLPGTPDMFRVTSLLLPNSHLLGSIPPDLGYIQHLRHLDLSNNFFNGSLPDSIFNATELQVMSLSKNEISGELPEIIGGLKGLKLLNLSDNALAGNIPKNLTALQNLTVLSLRTNYFSGFVPAGFNSVEVLDLSSNLLNGSLPLDFGGHELRYLNLSYNKISGSISPKFAKTIPGNATIDLSFNNLTGAIPGSLSLLNQKTESFRGNMDLCGKPLKNLCTIPSTFSTPPNSTTTSPAIAVIPKPLDSAPVPPNSTRTEGTTQNQAQTRLKPGKIVAITVADLAGIAILALAILYVYQVKRRKTTLLVNQTKTNPPKLPLEAIVPRADNEPRKPTKWSCLTIKNGGETSETTTSDSDHECKNEAGERCESGHNQKGGKLVMVDGETELETETLLKSTAYILKASVASIVYKAVLADGTAFAVRRIGEGTGAAAETFRDFEIQVRLMAKLRHPNLVKVRGFYWGIDEKLVIYDYVSNGNLATVGCRKAGSSPSLLSLDVRFKIARGIARGLAFIHEKKCVHGNIRPSNILLDSDLEPMISDFGLDRLVLGNNKYKASNSGRHFGSIRSMASTPQDHPITASPHAPSTAGGSCAASSSPYQAPESLKNLKPNPKWDVYSFGIVLLELLTGKVFPERELSQWTAGSTLEDKNRVLRLADVAIGSDVKANKDALVAGLKLGLSCASLEPEKRPSMKEALQILEKIFQTNDVFGTHKSGACWIKGGGLFCIVC